MSKMKQHAFDTFSFIISVTFIVHIKKGHGILIFKGIGDAFTFVNCLELGVLLVKHIWCGI